MNDLIYFWVDKYRPFQDPDTHATKYLFDDFGISLSSKYKVTHKRNGDGTLQFEVSETNIKSFFQATSEEECFYSKHISDIKVIAGKNGAGKSTLLELLSFVISGHESELDQSTPLEYCILWIDKDGSCQYDTNKENLNPKIFFNSSPIESIPPKKYKKEVILYSAVFNDEWQYSYPEGKRSNLQDIRTQYLIQQDIENFNNNPDMYGMNNRLACHSIMESIRQVNFVSAFIGKEDFLSSIFILPDKVYFMFSEGSLRNQIHSFLEKFNFVVDKHTDSAKQLSNFKDIINFTNNLNKKDDDQNIKRKEIENKWIQFFYKTQNLKLKIRFAVIFSNMYKYLNPLLNDWNFEEIEENLDDVKCEKLLNKIQSQLKISNFGNIENELYECLKNNCKENYFEYSLPSDKANKLLETIFNLKLHIPFMQMGWNRRLSSGESCYLRMFSRLYDSILNEKRFRSINSLEALFVADEVDLYLHPDWQRCWLSKFIQGIKLIQDDIGVNLNLHLVLATHSPFMLTDFSSESIVKLSREEDLSTKVQCSKSRTLAANIFDFLEDDFFLDSSIGEHIRQKIKELVDEIDRTNKTKEPLSDYSKKIINNIGDPIIKTLLINRKGLKND